MVDAVGDILPVLVCFVIKRLDLLWSADILILLLCFLFRWLVSVLFEQIWVGRLFIVVFIWLCFVSILYLVISINIIWAAILLISPIFLLPFNNDFWAVILLQSSGHFALILSDLKVSRSFRACWRYLSRPSLMLLSDHNVHLRELFRLRTVLGLLWSLLSHYWLFLNLAEGILNRSTFKDIYCLVALLRMDLLSLRLTMHFWMTFTLLWTGVSLGYFFLFWFLSLLL